MTPPEMMDLLRRLVEEYEALIDSDYVGRHSTLEQRIESMCPVLAEARALVSKR